MVTAGDRHDAGTDGEQLLQDAYGGGEENWTLQRRRSERIRNRLRNIQLPGD